MWWRKGRRERKEPTPAPTDPFVGRDRELARLQELVSLAAQGTPVALLIEGVPGMGKKVLLEEARKRATRQLPGAKFVNVYCYQATGSQDPFGPLAEALQLLAQEEKRDRAREAMGIIKEFGPDLLELVPVLGRTLSMAARIGGGIAGRVLSRQDPEMQARWENLPVQFERTLLELATRHELLALVIEDAQWIDGRSVEVLRRLSRKRDGGKAAIALLLALSPVPDDHPLREFQRESPGAVESMELGPLTEEEIAACVLARYGLPLSPILPSWLLARTEGKPLYVTEYLDLLEEDGVIKVTDGRPELVGDLSLAERRLPRDVADVLRQRIGRLDVEARKLLQLAAIHGQQFLSSTLAELRDEQELDLVARLEEVERQHRLVSFTSVERWGTKGSALYSFESRIQPTLYESVSRYRRLVLHRGIAQSLERFVATGDGGGQPPRKWVLEIARHYGEAEEPLLAARNYLLAAQSAFGDGGFREVVSICHEALAWVRNLPEGTEEHDRLRAEVIRLLLDARETAWLPHEDPDELRILLGLSEEAERAASTTGDLRLLAQVRYARAKLVLGTGRLEEALELFEEARSLAEQAGDALGQLIIMCDLGHHLDSADLAAGSAMLRRAYDLYRTGAVVAADWLEEKLLARHRSRLKGLIGVAEFDLGHYGDADRWLEDCVGELRGQGEREGLAWAQNFAAQLHIATGRYEEAVAELDEAIELAEGSTGASYQRSLLGKLYLEWDGHMAEATRVFEEVWETIPAGGLHHSVAPLVRNARAEFLIGREGPSDIGEARRLLELTVVEADQIGFQRTLISALSLLSRLALQQGQVTEALDWSSRSIETLELKKWFTPTVRTEEILFVHGLALRAAGREEEAMDFMRRALDVLEGKAESIPEPEIRTKYLERVPLSRRIARGG